MGEKLLEGLVKNSPLAVLVVGVLLFVLGAAGGWPPNIIISELYWRIGVALLGLVLTVYGLLLVWRGKDLGKTEGVPRMVLYSTNEQTTELRATNDGIELYLADIRPGRRSGIMGDIISLDDLRRIKREGLVRVYDDDKGNPLCDIGSKTHWLYSKTLWGNPKKLQQDIYRFIDKAIQIASK